MGMAQLTLIGNLGRDPEMSYTPDGTAVTKFSLAVSTGKGEKQETTWYNATAFRSIAETLNTYLKKGSQVFLQGNFTPRKYQTKDGKEGVSYDLIVDKFQFIGGKSEDRPSSSGFKDDALGDLDEHPF